MAFWDGVWALEKRRCHGDDDDGAKGGEDCSRGMERAMGGMKKEKERRRKGRGVIGRERERCVIGRERERDVGGGNGRGRSGEEWSMMIIGRGRCEESKGVVRWGFVKGRWRRGVWWEWMGCGKMARAKRVVKGLGAKGVGLAFEARMGAIGVERKRKEKEKGRCAKKKRKERRWPFRRRRMGAGWRTEKKGFGVRARFLKVCWQGGGHCSVWFGDLRTDVLDARRGGFS